MKSSAEKIAMKSYEDIFKPTSHEDQPGRTDSLPLDKVYPFKHHPFRLYNEEMMQEMVDSIKQNGVLMPILVRSLAEGVYEIISGHNRVEAAKRVGLTDVPAIICELDDDTAIVAMVDSNLRQREKLFPSEKAFAYKMRLDAIKRQGNRKDLTCVQVEHKSGEKKSRERIAEQSGESGVQVTRYIRLTNLAPPLLEMVDENHLAFNPAVAISYLEVEQQFWLKELMEKTQSTPSVAQAEKMKLLSQRETLDFCAMETIMNEAKSQQNRISLKGDKIQKYFSREYTPRQIEEVILKLLDQWHRQQQQKQSKGEHIPVDSIAYNEPSSQNMNMEL